jgi:hypothetical protein
MVSDVDLFSGMCFRVCLKYLVWQFWWPVCRKSVKGSDSSVLQLTQLLLWTLSSWLFVKNCDILAVGSVSMIRSRWCSTNFSHSWHTLLFQITWWHTTKFHFTEMGHATILGHKYVSAYKSLPCETAGVWKQHMLYKTIDVEPVCMCVCFMNPNYKR